MKINFKILDFCGNYDFKIIINDVLFKIREEI